MNSPLSPTVPPHTLVKLRQSEILAHSRWDPGFYGEQFREMERQLRKLNSVPLGNFIPDRLPDGSKGITYGQVGARHLNPRGAVRYLQVINIRETGIDFAVKPDRVVENSHNDPLRSWVRPEDILFTNNAFRGTETLIGRCVAVTCDYGKVNISQHIDRIRVVGINPIYVCCFLKSRLGALQLQRVMHGVDSSGINFDQIRGFQIPELPKKQQDEIARQYRAMAKSHDRAMTIKERLMEEAGVDPGQFGEAINKIASQNAAHNRAATEATQRLTHLLAQIEALAEEQQRVIEPFDR